MNYLNDPGREPLIRQILRADSLPEVHAAQAALREWRQRYPDDWGILDGGEQLSLIEDALREDDSPPGMSPSWTEWQRLEYQAMGAQTSPEVAAARRALVAWREQHPEEVDSDYLDTLLLLLDVVEERERGAAPSEERATRELVTV